MFFFGIVVSVFKNGLPFIVQFSGILSKLALILTMVSNSLEFIPLDSQSFKFKWFECQEFDLKIKLSLFGLSNLTGQFVCLLFL